MATELNPGGWEEGDAVPEAMEETGWGGDAEEIDASLPVEEAVAVSEVKLFNKW